MLPLDFEPMQLWDFVLCSERKKVKWEQITWRLSTMLYFYLFMMVQCQYCLHRQKEHTKLHMRFAFITELPGSSSSGRESPLTECVHRPKAQALTLLKWTGTSWHPDALFASSGRRSEEKGTDISELSRCSASSMREPESANQNFSQKCQNSSDRLMDNCPSLPPVYCKPCTKFAVVCWNFAGTLKWVMRLNNGVKNGLKLHSAQL